MNGRLPVREGLQHTHVASSTGQLYQPDRTQQVATLGGTTTHVHMWFTGQQNQTSIYMTWVIQLIESKKSPSLAKMFCIQECVREQLRNIVESKKCPSCAVSKIENCMQGELVLLHNSISLGNEHYPSNCSLTHSWTQNIFCKTWTLLGHSITTSIRHCAFPR